MKKVISLLLSAALLATAIFVAIPVSAETSSDPILATPLADATLAAPFWQYVSNQIIMPETTKKFVTANGVKLTAATGDETTSVASLSGQILASATYGEGVYALPENFVTNGSFIAYVKTDAANKMYFAVNTNCASGWYLYVGLKNNASYQYAAIGDTEWTTGTTVDSAIAFDAAFEGYVRIPVAALDAVDAVNSGIQTYDFLSQICTYFEKIGGTYGDIVSGPFFVTTSDSASTKIEVPEAYQPAPIPVTPMIGYSMDTFFWDTATHELVMPKATAKFVNAYGIKMTSYTGNEVANSSAILASGQYADVPYQMPTDFNTKGSFIMYVDTDGVNGMKFSVVADSNNGRTTYNLSSNASYEYLAIGGNEWVSATANGEWINFASAFEGYIKIPVSSLKSVDGYVIGEGFKNLYQIFAYFNNIGGQYGDITFGPFFTTTADSASTKFDIPEQYQPAPLAISSFDFGDVHAAAYNFSAGIKEGTSNYDLFIDKNVWPDGDEAVDQEEGKVDEFSGTNVWNYVENEAGIEGADSDACLVMNPTVKTYMKDFSGMVFYAEFPMANMFSPCLTFGNDSIMLKPGATVQVLANGSDEWVDMPVEKGNGDNALIYGVVKFNAAFSGYIKVPFSSLGSDWGWMPTLTGDNMSALTSIAVRFKGVGHADKYGENITFGVTGYYTEDTAKAEIGTVATPAYPNGDANYDWKVNGDDLTAIRKSILGFAGNTGYEVNIIDLIRVKKLLAGVQA